MLRYAIMGFLSHREMTGYELEQFISASTMHFWSAKLSQIYRTLKELEVEGMVQSRVEPGEGRPDRRVYTLTEAGRDDLRKWQRELSTEVDDPRIPSMVRFFFAGDLSGDEILLQLRVWGEVYQQRHQHFVEDLPQQMEMLKAVLPHTSNDALVWDSIRRLGELYMEMWVRWLAETRTRFEAPPDTD
jgi:PadR family transcriptional regulator AphA